MTAGYPSGPVMVWELAGRPRRQSITVDDAPAVCAMCGRHAEQTAATAKALGGNFTDQYLLAEPVSDRVCYACVWTCSGKPPDTVRMWTVAAAPGRVLPASHPKAPRWGTDHVYLTARNDMRAAVALLADPPPGPWLLSVAESGQKHHLPYARINHGHHRWTVRMDAVDVHATPAEFTAVFAAVVALRAAGVPSACIEPLTLPVGTCTPELLDTWQHHTPTLMPWRGSPLLHLACFLPNKEHLDEYTTAYPAR